MTDLPTDLHDLARLLVTLPGWEWWPGMRGLCESEGDWWRFYSATQAYGESGGVATFHCADQEEWGMLPDLADSATLGALLRLVRERRQDPEVSVLYDGTYGDKAESRWRAVTASRHVIITIATGPTEAHALVAALAALGGE